MKMKEIGPRREGLCTVNCRPLDPPMPTLVDLRGAAPSLHGPISFLIFTKHVKTLDILA